MSNADATILKGREKAGSGTGFKASDPRRFHNHPQHRQYRAEVRCWIREQSKLDHSSFPAEPSIDEQVGPVIVSVPARAMPGLEILADDAQRVA